MIDKRREEVAKLYAWNNRSDEGGEENMLDKARAFRSGINWFLDNLWHDISERMKLDRKILIEYDDKSYIVIKLRGENCRNNIPLKNRITRWLYIDDLIKGGTHEQ